MEFMPPIEEEIQQKTFQNEQQKAVINLMFTANWVHYKLSGMLREYGLSEQQFNILRILRGQGKKPVSIALLKERMLDKMSDVSRLVERLRSTGLLVRTTCPHDRRAVEIMITEEGLHLMAEVDKRQNEIDSCLQNLSEQELQFLNYLLDKIRSV